MRMWMVDPRRMCTQHLLGEHVELHMLVGSLRLGKSLDGFVANGLVEVASIRRRHQELVREMTRRGFRHKSPLPAFRARRLGRVVRRKSLADLLARCKKCRALARSR
jgi:hypothetical protein